MMDLWRKFVNLIKKYKRTSIIIGVTLLIIFTYFFIFYNLPSPENLKNFKITALSTHILDRNGKLLYQLYGTQERTPIKIKDLPPYVYQASISIEDKGFYQHQGVSFIGGIVRAIVDTILHRQLQGGSTITQQLVKTALLTSDRTIQRKAKEIVLALWTEKILNKNQILELYLNQIPYGGAIYGIEEASQQYFGIPAKDLSISEAAFLAGLPQAPSLYSPYNDPVLAINRRNEVLKAMLQQKYITQNQYNTAFNTNLKFKPFGEKIKAPHFVFYVKNLLEQKYSTQEIEEGGLIVTTSLDLGIQEQAETILKEELTKIKDLNVTNGAILVTRPPTGEILAMVGSVDYFASPSGAFNVTTALRQPGSSIKPLNYGIGLDRKLVTPATVFNDVPTCFTGGGQPTAYCPVNYDSKFHGPQQLRFALGNSFNIPAVKMMAINGVANFVASASAFSITSFKDPKNYGLSITLGGAEVRMTEMAQAYSAFANRGIVKTLNPILKIQDKFGNILYQFKDPNYVQNVTKPVSPPSFLSITGKQVISPEAAFLISHILLDNNARIAEFGTNSGLVIPGHAVSVKTGTTDDKRDNWTIGYTPNFLTAVWVGNDDNSPMNQALASGITGAAPVWNRVMTDVLKQQLDLWPIRPENVIGEQVCWDSGDLMTKGADGKPSCQSRFEYFIKGTEPKSPNMFKTSVSVTSDDKLALPNTPNTQMKEHTVIKDPFGLYCVDCNNDHPLLQTIVL